MIFLWGGLYALNQDWQLNSISADKGGRFTCWLIHGTVRRIAGWVGRRQFWNCSERGWSPWLLLSCPSLLLFPIFHPFLPTSPFCLTSLCVFCIYPPQCSLFSNFFSTFLPNLRIPFTLVLCVHSVYPSFYTWTSNSKLGGIISLHFTWVVLS